MGADADSRSAPKWVSAALVDLLLVALATVAAYGLSVGFELHERYLGWLARYERWQADEIPLSLLVRANEVIQ